MTMSLLRHTNIVMGSSAWRDGSWGDCRRLAVTEQIWCAAVDCFKHEQWQPEKLGHWRLITAYDGWLAMTTRRNVVDIAPRNLPAHKVRQQDTTALLLGSVVHVFERRYSCWINMMSLVIFLSTKRSSTLLPSQSRYPASVTYSMYTCRLVNMTKWDTLTMTCSMFVLLEANFMFYIVDDWIHVSMDPLFIINQWLDSICSCALACHDIT